MSILTSSTSFTVIETTPVYEDEVDLTLLPENSGVNALRELHYPGGALATLIYEDMPDKWTNFDTAPMTARPMYRAEMALGATKMTSWLGYTTDRPVVETWSGDANKKSRMSMYFLRRLWEYFVNPPSVGYITWYPKDRTTTIYNVIIENLTAGGQDIVNLDYLAVYNGYVMGEVNLVLRIVSVSPGYGASLSPSISESLSASASTSKSPSKSPSRSPSISPSSSPSTSISPSKSPSYSPSLSPSYSPSYSPSISPSESPSTSLSPSESPSPST